MSIKDNSQKPCDVCESDIVRTAVTVNKIKICHNCLKFFHYQAKLNKRTFAQEVQYQTNYINKNNKVNSI